jgi:hypothetical protein
VAHRATLLHEVERQTGIDILRDTPDHAADWLMQFAGDIALLRNQIAQFPITYYFSLADERTALAGILPYIAELADRAVKCTQSSALVVAGAALGGAVEDLCRLFAEGFLRMPADDKIATILALAREQMWKPVTSRPGGLNAA